MYNQPDERNHLFTGWAVRLGCTDCAGGAPPPAGSAQSNAAKGWAYVRMTNAGVVETQGRPNAYFVLTQGYVIAT